MAVAAGRAALGIAMFKSFGVIFAPVLFLAWLNGRRRTPTPERIPFFREVGLTVAGFGATYGAWTAYAAVFGSMARRSPTSRPGPDQKPPVVSPRARPRLVPRDPPTGSISCGATSDSSTPRCPLACKASSSSPRCSRSHSSPCGLRRRGPLVAGPSPPRAVTARRTRHRHRRRHRGESGCHRCDVRVLPRRRLPELPPHGQERPHPRALRVDAGASHRCVAGSRRAESSTAPRSVAPAVVRPRRS